MLAGRGIEVLEVQPGSPLSQWLADGKASAALVRPDFTVLRAGRDVAELCEAAPKFRPSRLLGLEILEQRDCASTWRVQIMCHFGSPLLPTGGEDRLLADGAPPTSCRFLRSAEFVPIGWHGPSLGR